MKNLPTTLPLHLIKTDENGTLTTTSLQVAGYFEKEHRNVLQAIDNLECSPEFRHANFSAGVYTLPETGEQQHRVFTITRPGVAFLVMGFTGKHAAMWKENYINAFEFLLGEHLKQKEVQLAQQHLVIDRQGQQLNAPEWAMLAHPGIPTPQYDALPAGMKEDGLGVAMYLADLHVHIAKLEARETKTAKEWREIAEDRGRELLKNNRIH